MTPLVQHFRRGMSRFRTAGLNLLFPPRCAACDADLAGGDSPFRLCGACLSALGPRSWPCCRRCGAAVVSERDPTKGCRLCRRHPLSFDAVIPLGGYQNELRGAVLRMKQPAHDSLSAVMGRLLAARREEQLTRWKPDLVVPVPMYWTRRLRRGTNSPEILAHHLGRHLAIPVRRVLSRRRNTFPQADLSPRERFRNVRGAFRVKRGRRLIGRRVLLVDDILTTGATCSEAAGVLKQAGAELVAAAVIARAQGPKAT